MGDLFTEQHIVDAYVKHCRNYHAHQDALRAFVKCVPLENNIFEIGVGSGTFTELLLSVGYDITGIDRSEKMLKRASKKVQALTEKCDLLDYAFSKDYAVVVSHSGGFTFKRGKFETYYQKEEDLEQVVQKVHSILYEKGRFFVNKGEHDDEIYLGDGATVSIEQEDERNTRTYTYTFKQGNKKITKQQKRLAIDPDELQTISSQYFNWNFNNGLWIVGDKYD